jgi:hypothetical protein
MKESLIKPAASQPILPLASSSNSIHSENELELMRQKLHDMGRDKEKMMAESALEKERKLTARLKVHVSLNHQCIHLCVPDTERVKVQGRRT